MLTPAIRLASYTHTLERAGDLVILRRLSERASGHNLSLEGFSAKLELRAGRELVDTLTTASGHLHLGALPAGIYPDVSAYTSKVPNVGIGVSKAHIDAQKWPLSKLKGTLEINDADGSTLYLMPIVIEQTRDETP